jgi:hypothetical protein
MPPAYFKGTHIVTLSTPTLGTAHHSRSPFVPFRDSRRASTATAPSFLDIIYHVVLVITITILLLLIPILIAIIIISVEIFVVPSLTGSHDRSDSGQRHCRRLTTRTLSQLIMLRLWLRLRLWLWLWLWL